MNMQQNEKFLKSKLNFKMEKYKDFNRQITMSYKTLAMSFSQEFDKFKKNSEFLEQRQKRILDEVKEVSHDMENVKKEVEKLSTNQSNTESNSKEAWNTIEQIYRKEENIVDD